MRKFLSFGLFICFIPFLTAQNHTVVVKGDELCSTTQSYSIEHGARLTLQAQPDSGYVFKQWADGNTDNPRVVLVESDITYVATYTALPNDDDPSDSDMVRCTIHMGECEKPFSQDFKLDTEIEIHAVPKEHGYFVQWSDGNTDNPRLLQLTEDVNLVAEFGTEQHSVSFLDWDGTVLQSTMVNYGEMPAYTALNPERAADAQYTYSFAGWDKELTVVTGAQTYTAQYSTTLNKYKVAFRDYDGALLQSNMVNYGEIPVYTGLEPEREATAQYSYIFTGWDKELTPVVEAVEYVAQYDSVVNQYTVSFLDWDGTVLQTSMVNYGEMPVYEGTPSREATVQYTYTFTGWDKELTAVTQAQTYVAQYDEALTQYAVTFLDWDETVLQSTMVNYGDMPSYEGTPSRAATAQYTYTFTGWDKEFKKVTRAQTYTAQYDSIVNQYEVSVIAADNGTVSGAGKYDYGTTIYLTATAKEGYRFVQWSDGNTDNPRTIVVVEDLELEAIFEIIDPTGLDNVGAQVNSVEKIFRDGLLIIRRDGVEYNAMGQKIQ